MGRPKLLVMLLLGLLIAPLANAAEGRAAPQCAELDLSVVISSSNGFTVDPGACVIIDIGDRDNGATLAFDYEVMDDAMDVLLFNEDTILPYNNGQNYRNSFTEEGSFESMIGNEWFDWSPPTATVKNWFVVFDNTAHDGDEGMGDQGGMSSRFKIQLAPISSEDFPLVHDTFIVESGQKVNLATFNTDAGTELNYWVHPIAGTGDIFVQSDNQVNGDSFISDTNSDDFGGQELTQLDWEVVSYLDLKNLNLMAEAGNTDLHFTVKAWLDPILAPTIVDYTNGTTVIGEKIVLDARNSPNKQNQIVSYSWDFDSDFIEDASQELVEASWNSPGNKIVTLTVQASSGETTLASHIIEVLDVSDPIAVITGSGGVLDINGNWRLLLTVDLVLTSANSNDDHQIVNRSWTIDGEMMENCFLDCTLSWSDVGTHSVSLKVTDASGNIGYRNTSISVYDDTKPVLVTSDISDIKEVEMGEEIEFKAGATDYWDDASTLIYTWDLDLDTDSNGDGDTSNDPDYTGRVLKKSFDTPGEHRFAVTVYDQSGNSDFEVFTVQVNEPPAETNIFAIVAIIFLIIIVVSGVVLFGYRGVQRRHAIDLLVQNGLSLEEATVRVYEIAKTTKLPPFAKAIQMAGMSDGSPVKSSEQVMSEEKAREFESIYGSDSQSQIDPNAGFRPSYQAPRIDPAFADAALAAFADEVEPKPVSKSSPVSGKVKSGGVALPVSNKPETHTLKSDCSSCGMPFSVTVPSSVNSAVVTCPSCGSEQLFER